jgi:hypothetical protein
MKSLISKLVDKVNSVLNQHQVKQFLSVVLVVFLLMPSTVMATGQNNKDINAKVNQWVHQNDDSDRPKTTREWNKEARQTNDEPGERIKRIGEESAEAVKDWGSLYPDVAKRSASELKENTVR